MTSAAYRCGDVAAFFLGGDRELIYSRDSGAAHVVPVDVADLLRRCERFGTLEELASGLSADLGLDVEERASVRQELERLAQLGLLVVRPDLRQVARVAARPLRIPRVGLVSGRCSADAVESHIASAVRHERTAEFIILDDDPDTARVTARLAALHRTAAQSILYASAADRRRFAQAVARETGVAADVVAFGVLGLPECAHRVGAQRNALILEAGGEAVLAVDGERSCEAALSSEHGGALVFASPSTPSAREVATRGVASGDLLGMHESVLGHGVPALLAAFADRGAPAVDLASPAFLRRLTRGEGHVAVTLNGEMPRTTIAERGVGSSPSLGIDTRELVPPFIPVERGSALVFGTLLERCRPDALLGWLPFTLARAASHRDGPSAEDGVSLAQVMDLVLRLGDVPPYGDAASRFRALGRNLQELATLAPDDFDHVVRIEVSRHAAHRLALRASLEDGTIMVPRDLREARTAAEARGLVRRLVTEFGRLLEAWPTIVEGANRLRARDERLARPVGAET